MFQVQSEIENFFIDTTTNNLEKTENFLNQNGKRIQEDIQTKTTDLKINKKKFKKLLKKEKTPPIYSESVNPVQCLNEYHRDIIFNFESETISTNKLKYKCNVDINKDQNCFKFNGEGISKKDAKKNCCLKALVSLYGDTYKPPSHLIASHNLESLDNQNTTVINEQDSLSKRIQKLCNKNTIQFKSPVQLLNELSKNIYDTGECVGENGMIQGKKFTFQYKNVKDDYDGSYGIAYGFGNSKKEAKSQAAKTALKLFLNCDLDKIANE